MHRTVVANIFSLAGAVLLGLSTFSGKKKGMLLIQAGGCAFDAMAGLLAGSWTGFTTNAISGIRNILNAKKKMTKPLVAVFSALTLAVGLVPLYMSYKLALGMEMKVGRPNTFHYLLQILPPVASVQYTVWSSEAKTAQLIRIGLLINLVMWCIHNFGMGLYPSAIMSTIVSFVTAVNILKGKEEKNGRKH